MQYIGSTHILMCYQWLLTPEVGSLHEHKCLICTCMCPGMKIRCREIERKLCLAAVSLCSCVAARSLKALSSTFIFVGD